ncbi:IctB family putative bicarbonate transporter [Tumidithrix helvetica PCC 7403]|uniref:IctB family putative bicarbonate transporter n=1 Tax=Tumidithrix helvetica TaxID=3457545 RepID=UPI003C8728A0
MDLISKAKAIPQQALQSLQFAQEWQQGSKLIGIKSLGALLLLLVVTLPYLENYLTGLIAVLCGVFWLTIWIGDRHDGQDPQVPPWTAIHSPLIVYWVIAAIATAISPVRVAALDGLIKLTTYFLIFVSFSRLMRLSPTSETSVDNENSGEDLAPLPTNKTTNNQMGWRSMFVAAYLATTLVVCAYGIQQWYLGAEELATWTDPTSELAGTTRIYSFIGNPNLLAGYLMPSLPLGVVAALHWRSWATKIFAALVAIAGVFCIVQTQSRGALVGIAVESLVLVLLLVYWWGRRLPIWALPSFFGGTIGIMVLSVLLFPKLRSRVESIFSGGGDSSNSFRLNVWPAVFKMIKARPIFGIGPGNKAFNQVYPVYQSSGFSALGTYSVPLEITVETGFVGAACYLWLVAMVIRVGWQNLNRVRSLRVSEGLWIVAALSIIAGMIVHGLVDTVWYRPQVQILWWLEIALIASFCLNPISNSEVNASVNLESSSELPETQT